MNNSVYYSANTNSKVDTHTIPNSVKDAAQVEWRVVRLYKRTTSIIVSGKRLFALVRTTIFLSFLSFPSFPSLPAIFFFFFFFFFFSFLPLFIIAFCINLIVIAVVIVLECIFGLYYYCFFLRIVCILTCRHSHHCLSTSWDFLITSKKEDHFPYRLRSLRFAKSFKLDPPLLRNRHRRRVRESHPTKRG